MYKIAPHAINLNLISSLGAQRFNVLVLYKFIVSLLGGDINYLPKEYLPRHLLGGDIKYLPKSIAFQ